MRKSLSTLIVAGLTALALPAAADVKFELNLFQPARHAAADAYGARVNQYVRHGSLPVRQLVGLGSNFNGRQIQAVEVTLRPNHPGTRVALIGDGRVRDAERVGHDGRVVLHPGWGGVLGRDLHRVQLDIDGGAFVHAVRVILAPDLRYAPARPPVVWQRHDDRHDRWDRHDRRDRRDDGHNRNRG
jgi:hypothetical protein